jgi:hypothetical protein
VLKAHQTHASPITCSSAQKLLVAMAAQLQLPTKHLRLLQQHLLQVCQLVLVQVDTPSDY